MGDPDDNKHSTAQVQVQSEMMTRLRTSEHACDGADTLALSETAHEHSIDRAAEGTYMSIYICIQDADDCSTGVLCSCSAS